MFHELTNDYSQAKHANGENSWGVNGDNGKIVDMKSYGLYESASVKIQTLKTAIEVSFYSRPKFFFWLINDSWRLRACYFG
jgi:chaperonin GroEL (HSP60 family)